ncbi:MAG: hypothetical protein DRI61_12605 [Chloroflexi bacterium]|nr:MAG: hypothetical protein DRI61_12605 [Chloroflexota bacterium]
MGGFACAGSHLRFLHHQHPHLLRHLGGADPEPERAHRLCGASFAGPCRLLRHRSLHIGAAHHPLWLALLPGLPGGDGGDRPRGWLPRPAEPAGAPRLPGAGYDGHQFRGGGRFQVRGLLRLVEQNAHEALQVVDRGYVLENGRFVLEGSAEELRRNPKVQAAYLGGM